MHKAYRKLTRGIAGFCINPGRPSFDVRDFRASAGSPDHILGGRFQIVMGGRFDSILGGRFRMEYATTLT